MTLENTPAGLTIETLAEIKEALEASYRAAFGENINVQPEEPLGQIIGIESEGEANIQLRLQDLAGSDDVTSESDARLTILAAQTGTNRLPGTRSVIPAPDARFVGTPGTIIPDGSQVRLIQTQTVWDVVDGPYTIGGGGDVTGSVRAVEDGPTVALTTATTGWEIVTPVPGWTAFENTEDANIGSTQETDLALRRRQQAELLRDGSDIDAMRGNVSAVSGVTFVRVFENASDTTTPSGVPPRAVEIVVEGGPDLDIVEAIRLTKPPGAETFGNTGPFPVELSPGTGLFDIFFSRPSDVDIWIVVDVTTTGAEDEFPANGIQDIADAVLAFALANHQIGDDVIPDTFIGTVYGAVGNVKNMRNVVVKLSEVDFPSATDSVIDIDIKQKADFDSARIQVNRL